MCFYCGRIGHTIKLCPGGNNDLSKEDKKNLKYGMWLHAENLKSTLISEFTFAAEMECEESTTIESEDVDIERVLMWKHDA